MLVTRLGVFKYIAVMAAISRQRGMIAYWLKHGEAFDGPDYRAFVKHVINKCKRRRRLRLD